jgi:hypothetical protein
MLASPQDLPVSSCSTVNTSSAWSSSQSRHFPSHRERPSTPSSFHPRWASRSLAATASTSADVATGTLPTTFPVAGQVTTTSWGTSAFGGFVGAAVSVLIAITSAE